jgi:hypothetical protein
MFPWKDFLLGWIRKIQKHKEERDRSGKFKKTRRKEWRKEKEEIFMYVEVLMCFPSVGNTLGVPPSCDPPSGEPTHMGTSPTTKFPINTGVKIGVRGREWKGDHCLLQSSQISAVVVGPSFMFMNFSRTNLWGLWQKYVSSCFENQ